MDDLAQSRSALGSGDSPLEKLSSDLLRPPWSSDLPGRVAAVAREGPLEALCTADCRPELCGKGLCWHCWHRDECGGRPAEIQELLQAVRAQGEAATLGHRARLAEMCWSYPTQLASAVEEAVSSIRSSGAVSAPKVLVLGGLGVCAVQAAKAGAEVVLWEPASLLTATLRAVMRANGVSSSVKVVETLGSLQEEASTAHVFALEGLEPDGLLGTGVLERWQLLAAVRRERGLAPATVLPVSVQATVALAAGRLVSAAGIEGGPHLEPFADSHGGMAPLPHALHEGKARGSASAAVLPVELSLPELTAEIDLAGEQLREGWRGGAHSLQLKLIEDGKPDSLLLGWSAEFGNSRRWCGRSLQPLPARLQQLQRGTAVEVLCSANSQRLWFEVVDTSQYATPPLPRMFLLAWYSEMMNDEARNVAFFAALRAAVCQAKRDGRCRVADLGCGVGVLSLLSLRAGADDVLGVEIAPHLARCAQQVLTTAAESLPGQASVFCGDIRTVDIEEDERFDVVVAELLDAGGLGEKIVAYMRHAKSRLLRHGGVVVPRGLRIMAALVDASLPSAGGAASPVNMKAFEPFWLPARASSGEWLGVDLDAGADWAPASEAIEVFSLNFAGAQADLAAALQEREICFPLLGQSDNSSARCNAIAWWFEADVGGGEEGTCDLTSAPSRFRPHHCSSTHWVQALAGLGPWQFRDDARCLRMRVRTDGAHITWTPMDMEVEASVPKWVDLPSVETPAWSLAQAEIEAWRSQGADASETLANMQQSLLKFGDLARLHAVQAAALHVAAQPGVFGLEATHETISRPLVSFFV
eukprot:TRINITY_DN77665_c0_g1_i1.p1 TRINITY_DN77665_c0_g1~~TRINITY_DN77665_c0_g1_i1.p1  ORF type:complete len:883 (-),score=219.92 TRINITY_DN77665_c0_g1_i1:16-2457(-)